MKTSGSFLDQKFGNITINRVEQQVYAGSTRTVLDASTNQSSYVWDQATGVSLEGTSLQPDYSMHTVILGTNLWQPSGRLELSVLILIAFAAAITLVVAGIIVVNSRKKKAR